MSAPSPSPLAALRRLARAEEFFQFFGLPFEPRVVDVYRLHILRRFGLEVERIDREAPALDERARLALYREALGRAHDVFLRSTAQEEKLFKVFQDGGVVTLARRRP